MSYPPVLSFRVPADQIAQLNAIADKQNTKRSAVAQVAIAEFLRLYNAQIDKTRTARNCAGSDLLNSDAQA